MKSGGGGSEEEREREMVLIIQAACKTQHGSLGLCVMSIIIHQFCLNWASLAQHRSEQSTHLETH